jgi:hypothetical protein
MLALPPVPPPVPGKLVVPALNPAAPSALKKSGGLACSAEHANPAMTAINANLETSTSRMTVLAGEGCRGAIHGRNMTST